MPKKTNEGSNSGSSKYNRRRWQIPSKEVKKGTDETNQKNDLFNSWLKMCRHSATVDNFPFIKVFTDEQRPESWGSL